MTGLVDLVRAFRGLRTLVIGDAMLDSYLEGSATRLCSEGPVPVVRRTAEEHIPGGAANSAANVRALGAEVSFLGVVGDDEAGRLLRRSLVERGIDDRWVITDPEVSTLHKQRILADEQYVVRYDAGDTRSISAATHMRLFQAMEEEMGRCDVVLIADYRYGVLSDALLRRLTELRAVHPCPLVVDSKALHRFVGTRPTVVTPNHLEASLAIDPSSSMAGEIDLHEIEGIGRKLREMLDSDSVAVTLGSMGVLLVFRSGAGIHLPAHPVSRANDVGAGDSFTAALALGLGTGGSAIEAARIGIAAAGIAVSRQRTAVVHQQELLQRVSLDDYPLPPSLSALRTTLEEQRYEGKKIVFTNGVFDILHAGHVHFLRQARQLGDVLVVGVNSDRSARRLKGPNRPINSERDRLALVAAMDAVDHVVLFDEDNPIQLIHALQPDIHVKGGDYAGAELPEEEAVRAIGGEIVILPLFEGWSTSSVIDRILALAGSGGREYRHDR